MRKYVKPMMESEAFISNEYVSACYFADCVCSDDPGVLIKNVKDTNAAATEMGATPIDVSIGNVGGYVFIGTMGTSPSCPNVQTDSCTGADGLEDINRWIRIWNFFLGWLWTIPERTTEITDHHISFTNANSIAGYKHPNASI